MIYFISSSTKWPSNKDASVFFRYITPENNLRFGNLNIVSNTIISSIEDYEAIFFNRELFQQNIKADQESIGEVLNQKILYSFISLAENSNYKNEYRERANNIFEMLETNVIEFWNDFEILIKLAFQEMQNSKKKIDTFFMYLNFFPAHLMKDLDSFYTKLFSILNNSPNETFVIILDPISIHSLSYFKGFFHKYGDKFNAEIIGRIKPSLTSSSVKNLFAVNYNLNETRNENNQNFELENIFDSGELEKWIAKKYNNETINNILKIFNNLTETYIEWDNHYASYKERLFNQYSIKISKMHLPLQKSIRNFYNKYFIKNVEFEKALFAIFQRLPTKEEKKINPKDFNCKWTYYKLSKELKCWNEENEDKIKNLCRKSTKLTNGAALKNIIYQASISADLSYNTTLILLKNYGFDFVDYSPLDLIFAFLWDKINSGIISKIYEKRAFFDNSKSVIARYESNFNEDWKQNTEWKYKNTK